jgi:23S rRNA (cytidine1920-2'-O)/16S rRNA (cytidine1409-2'-O)-methyltransferase
VRDPEVQQRVVDEISAQAPDWGAKVEGVADSGLPGPKGNREFFLYLRAA